MPVTVPQDFGRNLLQFEGFNDLTIKVKGDVILRANSAIVAFNSPVVMRQISSTGVPEICLDEVGEEGAKRFLECCYSGDATGQISEKFFRDFSKTARALDVTWIKASCNDFFEDLCADLKTNSVKEGQFLIAEAGFLLKESGDRSLLEILHKRLLHLPDLKRILLSHFVIHQINHLDGIYSDLCRDMAGPETFRALTKVILARKKNTGEVIVTSNERRLLTQKSLTACWKENMQVYENLFDVLKSSNDIDLVRFLLKLSRKSTRDFEPPAKRVRMEPRIGGKKATPTHNGSKKAPTKLYPFLRDFSGYHSCGDLKDLLIKLLNDNQTKTFEMLLDAIFVWNCSDPSNDRSFLMCSIIERNGLLEAAKEKFTDCHISQLEGFISELGVINKSLFRKVLKWYRPPGIGDFLIDYRETNKIEYDVSGGFGSFSKELKKKRLIEVPRPRDGSCTRPGKCFLPLKLTPTRERTLKATSVGDVIEVTGLMKGGHLHRCVDLLHTHLYLFFHQPENDSMGHPWPVACYPLSWWSRWSWGHVRRLLEAYSHVCVHAVTFSTCK